MSPRPDVSDERKNQILDAASNVFTRLGFHKARMDDIVEESGLSKGALYWYYKSKDDLIFAIFDRMFEREFETLRQMQYAEGSATERLWAYIDLAIEDVNKMMRLMPIAYEFMALAFRKKFVQEAFTRYFHGYLDTLVPIIDQGIEAGEFRLVHAHDVALAAGAIVEGTILLWVYDKSAVDVPKHIRSGINFIIEGIKA
jgi:AcrR family transcriptional regulator